jgi:hypothetical protein
MTLATDVARQHWAAALDASREAVLVIVGWAALIIVLSAEDGSATTTEQSGSGSAENGHAQAEPAPDTESVEAAQWRVHRLRARLAELADARERGGSGTDPDLDREVASTTARLEHARQWLTSAQSALAVSRKEGRQLSRTAGSGAERLIAATG